jgi:hypothetical protein
MGMLKHGGWWRQDFLSVYVRTRVRSQLRAPLLVLPFPPLLVLILLVLVPIIVDEGQLAYMASLS